MKRNMELELKLKIQETYGMSASEAQGKSEKILRECPPQLMQNILEWAAGKPLSDIYIDRYSIPMVMSIWENNDFLRALSVVIELLQGDADKAVRQIWNMRR